MLLKFIIKLTFPIRNFTVPLPLITGTVKFDASSLWLELQLDSCGQIFDNILPVQLAGS